MLGCRFCFELYAKNIREKTTKCSLKTKDILLDADGMCLPKFNICQGTVALNCFKAAVSPSKKKNFYLLQSHLKMMKNPFYFILKALFGLKIFKFLFWHFAHVEEMA